ncbi:MAG: amidohydrolase [Tissierellia bacterium]|nr:amidohydrolase [Bacillota bacterium]NLL23031.1 amidohydrolase [Tissierellia bacterium]
MDAKRANDWIKKNAEEIGDVSKQIWNMAETAFCEAGSSKLLMRLLEEEGFTIERYEAIPTAFRAVYGTGFPVIGLLAEYDALPGLSQKVSTQKEPAEEDAPGHGCGHNLMAGACLAAALALKEAMESEDEYTIVFYGCPAEEILVGKGFMAREGAFRELDVAVSWHPGKENTVLGTTMTALEAGEFHFRGKTAHAAADPYNGRSALDAVEIMDIGANYLREHVTADVRIHYQITGGGGAPNIVPDKASVLYFTRANNRTHLLETFERVKKCAEGASVMTETDYELRSRGGCYEVLVNETLVHLMNEAMEEAQPPVYTQEELEFAEALNRTSASYEKASKQEDYESIITGVQGVVRSPVGGSTDVGDVSYIVPLVMFMSASHNSLSTGHSWHITATSGHTIGQKGMLYATRSIVRFVEKLLLNPQVLEKAKTEFEESTKDHLYRCPIAPEMKVEDLLS